jgi:hypothetical protein
MRISLLLVAILITGCETIREVPVDLSSKLPPDLQKHEMPSERELMCLSDEGYEKVVKLHKRIITLKNIILSTQP